jgi:hypothetical protein
MYKTTANGVALRVVKTNLSKPRAGKKPPVCGWMVHFPDNAWLWFSQMGNIGRMTEILLTDALNSMAPIALSYGRNVRIMRMRNRRKPVYARGCGILMIGQTGE